MPEQYMKKYGPGLFEAGFEIIPIVPKKKNPSVENWRDLEITQELVDEWVKERPHHGVGIRGSSCPALDIDIDHPEAGPEMQAFIDDTIGRGPIRRGKGDKVLLPVECDILRKQKSTIYTDAQGNLFAIELLSDGQQWVARGFHEGAGRDYIWERGELITASILGDLPVLSADGLTRIFAKWDEIASRYGFTLYKKQRTQEITEGASSGDAQAAILEGIKQTVGLTIEELTDVVMEFPCDTYDDWYKGGMAIYHETGGSTDGLELFDIWSTTGTGYPGFEDVKEKWETFSDVGPSGDTITIRSYLHELNERGKQEKKLAFETFKKRIENCADPDQLFEGIAGDIAANDQLNKIARNILASLITSRYRALSGVMLKNKDAQRLVAFKDPTGKKRLAQHKWVADWVWLKDRDRFYNLKTKSCITKDSFNAEHNRIFKEEDKPNAAAFALEQLDIPIIDQIQYHPGEGDTFTANINGMDRLVVNSYSPLSCPEPLPRENWRPKDKKNVALVETHIRELFNDPYESTTMIDWLAWVVQHPGEIVRWAVVLIGVQGDGKTFIAEMMSRVLGRSNISLINHQVIEARYTSWAADAQMVVFDEVRMSGKNRFQVMDMLKSYIGNDTIVVAERYIKEYTAINMASYFMTSNHQDALALTDDDRRFWPVKTKWASRQEMIASGTRDEKYFKALFNAIEESTPALRQWLLDWQISEDFSANHLPRPTALARTMIDTAKCELLTAFEQMVSENVSPYITNDIVSSTSFSSILNGTEGHFQLETKATNKRLNRFFTLTLGYSKYCIIKIDGVKHTIWVRDPKALPSEESTARTFVRDLFLQRRREFEKEYADATT
jgi:hypothetical protein